MHGAFLFSYQTNVINNSPYSLIQLSNDNIEISDIFIKCCQQLIYQGWLKPEI